MNCVVKQFETIYCLESDSTIQNIVPQGKVTQEKSQLTWVGVEGNSRRVLFLLWNDWADLFLINPRYALKDLWESERDYVRDLSFTMESYYSPFQKKTPDAFAGRTDVLFSSLPSLLSFHDKYTDHGLIDISRLFKTSYNAIFGFCFNFHVMIRLCYKEVRF